MSNATKLKQLTLQLENDLNRQGYDLVIGIDEAGRGPLAGPVVASAVCLRSFEFTHLVTDSKKLTHLQRERVFHQITSQSFVGVGIINEAIIDEVNILQATYLAMNQAVRHLIVQLPEDRRGGRVHLLIDGNSYKPDHKHSYQTIVEGDAKVLSIACASIVAKVIRDRIMEIYDKIFPDYGLAGHKGYPTKTHREAVQRLGPSLIHRKSFAGSLKI